MSKLHELLAVDANLSAQAAKLTNELKGTFEKKRHLFEEKRTTFQPKEDGSVAVTEQQSDLQTTVVDELSWISEHLAKAIDVSHQINLGNMAAQADVLLEDGSAILSGVPATTLLELEKSVKHIQDLISQVPTLDPAKGFRPDPDRGKGIYAAREVVKQRTKKVPKVIVKYDATKEHPAQTELISLDEPIGEIREQEWSALLTPADKAAMLARCEDLVRAIKKARSRANDLDVVQNGNKIGATLLRHILGDGVVK